MPVFVPASKQKLRTDTPGGGTFVPSAKPAPVQAKKKSGGGIGGFLGHIPGAKAVGKVVGQGGADIYHAAVNTPSGVYHLGKHGLQDVGGFAQNLPLELSTIGSHRPEGLKRTGRVGEDVAAMGKQTAQDFQHPLRHPGNTLLDVVGAASLGAGTAAKLGAAGKALRAGEGVGAATRAVTKSAAPGVRTFKVGDLDVTKPASKAASTRLVQKAIDTRLQKSAAKNPGGRAAKAIVRQVGPALQETLRIEESLAKVPAAGLQALGKRLKPSEQMALRVVAEQAPLEKRIAAAKERQAASSGLEARRHGARVKLLEQARTHIVDTAGKPELASPRLQAVFAKMEKVAGSREELGKQLGLLTDEMIQGRKTSALRAAQGLPLHDEKVPEPPTPGQLSLVEPPKSKLPTASPEATYVPDVEQKLGSSGRITSVGSRGTVGTPQNPFKYGYTGGAKASAREPLNTTKAVAEANLAVTKYARLVNLQGKLRKAASPTPRFKDDIAVRLDKIGKHETLPADVKAFVNDPSKLEHLSPDEQTSKLEQLRKTFVLGNDKEIQQLAPEQLAEYAKLHEQGKIGWVPQRLLGDLAKPHAPLSATLGKPAVAVVDATNNATKLSVLYLKFAYAVPNLLGNAALNLVQQGFAAPSNLRRAVTLTHSIGPELTAHVDTLMGEGFATALRGEQGALSAATQAAANIWGKGVDKPFRRASFLHEAGLEGFKSPARVKELLTDPAHHEALINATKRANREIIDYGRLSSREREIIRRIIFFYPWVKGSTLYAGNFLLEHPVKAAASGQLGVQGRKESQAELGPTPSFLEGAFKAGGGLVNPSSAAILQTPAQVAAALSGLAGGSAPASSDLPQFLTPALSVIANEVAGKNLFSGKVYGKGEKGLLNVARDTLVSSSPQAQLYQGLAGKSKSKLYPASPRTAIARYLVGGLYPRPYSPSRLHILARQEQRAK